MGAKGNMSYIRELQLRNLDQKRGDGVNTVSSVGAYAPGKKPVRSISELNRRKEGEVVPFS